MVLGCVELIACKLCGCVSLFSPSLQDAALAIYTRAVQEVFKFVSVKNLKSAIELFRFQYKVCLSWVLKNGL